MKTQKTNKSNKEVKTVKNPFTSGGKTKTVVPSTTISTDKLVSYLKKNKIVADRINERGYKVSELDSLVYNEILYTKSDGKFRYKIAYTVYLKDDDYFYLHFSFNCDKDGKKLKK